MYCDYITNTEQMFLHNITNEMVFYNVGNAIPNAKVSLSQLNIV